jgi:hypothetical protein
MTPFIAANITFIAVDVMLTTSMMMVTTTMVMVYANITTIALATSIFIANYTTPAATLTPFITTVA